MRPSTSVMTHGVSETVARKLGLVMKDRETLQNPYALTAKRTFPEVEQPAASLRPSGPAM